MSSPPTHATRRPEGRRPSLSSNASSSPTIGAAQLASPGIAEDSEEAATTPLAIDADSPRPGSPDLPLTMTASAVLSRLPRDATAALAEAGTFPPELKVVVRFKPVGGNAPQLGRSVYKISASQRFEFVVLSLRKFLKVAPSDSVFLYVNSTFAPALDEIVGNLHRCFKDSNDQLNVSYSMTPAFG